MASYPTTPVIFPARSDGQTIFAQHLNAVQDEIAAIEASLVGGQLPSPQTIIGGQPMLVLDSTAALSNARLIKGASGDFYINNNVIPSGDADDVALPQTQLLLPGAAGGLMIYTSAAGPNPRSMSMVAKIGLDGSITERARSQAMGQWVDVAFNAGNFSAVGGTWTVPGGAVQAYKYSIVGNTVSALITLGAATIVGTPSVLRLTLPLPISPANNIYGGVYAHSTSGPWVAASFTATVGQTYLTLYPAMAQSGTWSASAAGQYLTLMVTYPI